MAEDFRNLITSRRDGKPHTQDELAHLANGAARGEIPDYQLSAWLMAAYLNPLDLEGTKNLTMAMADSGERLDLSGLPGPHLDKHSTGGVGDKTTLVLLPLLAASGLAIVKMSGAGLGITGGTVDKLASIPGFEVNLSAARMVSQAQEIGLALSAQTDSLAPADRALYALRDATATTASMPLIVSSILSKKIAGGADIVSLDVKCGAGGFMPDLASASALRDALIQVGSECGLQVIAEITDMSQPLGSAIGNALEVREALAILENETLSPPGQRFRELCLHLAANALVVTGKSIDFPSGYALAENLLNSGQARQKAESWIAAQGGARSLEAVKAALPLSDFCKSVTSDREGFIHRIDARKVGEIVVDLGGGRKKKSDKIDPAVGVTLSHFVSNRVVVGQDIAFVHGSSSEATEAATARLLEAIEIGSEPKDPIPLILG